MSDLNLFPLSARAAGQAATLTSQEVACDHCGMFGMCEEAGLSREPQLLEQVVSRRTALARHDELFHANDSFQHIYAVKSGALAAVGEDGKGQRKVFSFYFPGDMLGLDAIESGYYDSTVVALEKSSVCKLDYANVALLGEHQSSFYHQLIYAMSNRLRLERWTSLLLGTQSTEQRLAVFMLYLASHLKAHGLAHVEFRLPMTRSDIADYLGMAMETVSRAFTSLQKRGVLVVQGRNTRISDLEGLLAVTGLEYPSVSV